MLLTGTASAQSGRGDLASDTDAMITARLKHVERVLSQDERETRRWWRAWIGIQSALFAGNVGWGLITFDDTGARAEHFLNAGGSLLGGLSLLVLRPPALRAPAELAELSERTPTQRALKLEAAESLLAESADAQAFGTGWAPYTGAVVVGTAIAVPLWLKYDRKLGAAATMFGSIALTTAQVATLPTASLKERSERVRGNTMPPFADAQRKAAHSGGPHSTRMLPEQSGPVSEEDPEDRVPTAKRIRAPGSSSLTLSIVPSPGGLTLAGSW